MNIKYSTDKRVAFREKDHSYILDGKKRLTSVTQLISKYKHPFEAEKIARKYAKKHRMKVEDVLAMWKAKGEEASTMGTAVHKVFEDYIETGEIITPGVWPKENVARRTIQQIFLSGRLTPVATELIVYNENYAGQIDCIAKDEAGRHYILDWKTNKEIKFSNPWQNMLPPYDDLDDTSFNHYSMQLRIYKELCTEYEIEECYIVHIGEEHSTFYSVRKDIILPL